MRGATRASSAIVMTPSNFNPRTPCGVRLPHCFHAGLQRKFQSTHPMRGATGMDPQRTAAMEISIHAPHAGCDRWSTSAAPQATSFQSTHPMRGATCLSDKGHTLLDISIHAPHAGCDFPIAFMRGSNANFNPRTPCGVRRTQGGQAWKGSSFQSTHPMRGAT